MLHKEKPAGAGAPPTGSTQNSPTISLVQGISAKLDRLACELYQAHREAKELAQARTELRRLVDRMAQSQQEHGHGI